MLSIFGIMLLVLSGAALVTYLLQNDDGYILIHFGSTSIEVRFWFGVIVTILVVCVLLWVLKRLKALVVALGVGLNWWSESKAKKAKHNATQGLIHFIEGNFEAAKKELLASSKYSKSPFLHYLAGAESAIALNNIQEAEFLLGKAERLSGKHQPFVRFCYARCDYLQHRYAPCIEKLEELLREEKNNQQVLELLCRALIQNDSFARIIELLPRLNKSDVFSKREYEAIRLNSYLSFFSQQISLHSSANIDAIKNTLFEFWRVLPKDLKNHVDMLDRYTHEMVKVGLTDDAESLLFTQLNKQWDDRLVVLYGSLECDDEKIHLEHIEKWSKQQADNSAYLLAFGKVAIRNELWGQAKELIERSVQLSPSVEGFIVLAKLYNKLNDSTREKECLQQSMSFIEQQL